MSRSYFILIALLVLVDVGVGAFAFYRSVPKTQPTLIPVQNIIYPSSIPTPAPKNQVSLIISSPKNNQTVSSPNLTVSGSTVSNADVSVNDKDLSADSKGNFSTTVTLDEGENEILVVTSDESGNFSEQTVLVTYTPAQ